MTSLLQKGYEFGADNRLCTIFSAPNYCGDGDNAGAVMEITKDFKVSDGSLGKKKEFR